MITEIFLNDFAKKIILTLDEEVGYIEIQKLYEVLDIIDIVIYEEYRKKGFASKLLQYVIDNNKNVEKIMLEVREDNYPAIKLYEKFDFKKIGERKKYYKDKSAYIMERVVK